MLRWPCHILFAVKIPTLSIQNSQAEFQRATIMTNNFFVQGIYDLQIFLVIGEVLILNI